MDINEVTLSGTVKGIVYPEYKHEAKRYIYILLSTCFEKDGCSCFDVYRVKFFTKDSREQIQKLSEYQKSQSRVFVKGFIRTTRYKDSLGEEFYSNSIVASKISTQIQQ
ncbi:MAG: single-stranded DNA-binding protein [Succinivibrio sp.]|uniref:Single-stranded DNA-binding protein n=1 Tax=Succinivibrio faecicola TaxID=2820300 RepID=A0ABS7DFT1_9GAMM|nr:MULTISPECIES: single-stranded DNA-binding protein [Succinivibrio]MBW7570160.1 single-stranded DNA-binding protein [Succinivibrio faecicola]MCI6939387.1 single-stranded DNA-binding protein [Succinatimonas hippei]MDD6206579.1 single-stranded DNA-binding protein [Succinivibrio sp.]